MASWTTLQAITSAIGDELTMLGGVRITRLTAAVPAGQTTLPVENSLPFASSGKVLVDGVSYLYTGNADGTLTGIGYLLGGALITGTRVPHAALDAVFDVSQVYSGGDLVRGAVLSDTASGADLNALGRNLGVPRIPGVTNDALYRAIIQAIAYSPRGTFFGATQALDALLGPGNYALTEDLINYPNQAFLRVPQASLSYAGTSIGKAYLTGPQTYQQTGTEVSFVQTGSYGRVVSVTAPVENFLTNCRTTLPTTTSLPAQYPGDPGQIPWANANEAAGSAINAAYGGCTRLTGGGVCAWTHAVTMTSAATWGFSALVAFPAGSTMPASGSIVMQVADGSRMLQISFVAGTTGWTYVTNTPGLAGPANIPFDQPVEILVQRRGPTAATAMIRIHLNGSVQSSAAYTAIPTSSTAPQLVVGRIVSGTACALSIKQLGVSVSDPTDAWSYTAPAQAQASLPQSVTVSAATFAAADVGKQLRLYGSAAANAQGGNNNCTAQVAQVTSPTQVVLGGIPRPGASVSASSPQQIVVGSSPRALTFPDDLGKQIVVSGSAGGNNGAFTITALYDIGTGLSLSSFQNRVPVGTNVCGVAGASFGTESNLTTALVPQLVTENANYAGALTAELSDAGSAAAPNASGVVAISFRNGAVPTRGGLRVRVEGNSVLSAQTLGQASLANAPVAGGGYAYYPFYVDNPLALLQAYIHSVLPAGLILNITTY